MVGTLAGDEPLEGATSFVEVLVELHHAKQTGVLEVRADDVLTIVYLREGVPVSVEAGILGQTIGRVLREQQLLTDEQLREVIDVMTEQLFEDEQVRFGEVAVSLGFLTVEQVHEALAEQVRQRVMHCLQWEQTSCRFRRSREALRAITPFPCPVEPLLLDGVKRYFEPERVDRIVSGHADHYPLLREPIDRIGQRFGLDPAEQHMVVSLDGTTSLRELVARSSLDDHHAGQVVVALLLARKLELLAHPRSQAGPERGAGQRRPAVQARHVSPPVAVQRPARRPRAPVRPPVVVDDTHGPGPSAGTAPVAKPATRTSVASADTAAGGGSGVDGSAEPATAPPWLASEPIASTPPPRDVQRARLLAERSFVDGKASLKNGRFRKAAQQLAKARDLRPDTTEYELYAAWAELCDTDDPDLAQARRDGLEELAKRALREDRRFAFAHYVKGQLALARRDYEVAVGCFGRALQLEPTDGDAKRHYVIARRRQRG